MSRYVHLPDSEAPQWGVLAGWAMRHGEPNRIGEERPSAPTYDRLFVARDDAGLTAAVLLVRLDFSSREPTSLIAITRVDLRRRGLASALFEAARRTGIGVEALSGINGLTDAGAAFQRARRAQNESPRG